ncbi:MAG: translation initiation factor [Caldithrix sp.]|nr:translation initiation factor [Caldithrix sp.]
MAKKKNIVYSTHDNIDRDSKKDVASADTSLHAERENTVYIELDRKGRAGKNVTLVKGLSGNLKSLKKDLQKECGSGGSVKSGNIEIQGDHKEHIGQFLQNMGFKVKHVGG